MRTIIAGSRHITDAAVVAQAVEASGFKITEVVSGRAAGVDTLGEQWASARGIATVFFMASWETHGKAAGPMRNARMAEYADALVAVWDGQSRGTADMIGKARKRGLRVHVHTVEEEAWL